MKIEFTELLEENFDRQYLDYIDFLDPNKKQKLTNAFNEENLLERERKIKENVLSDYDVSFNKKLANPYYIGFGNPNSSILFIGKEKAFAADNLNLLVKESINNYKQWQQILSANLIENDQTETCQKLGFSPLLPKAYHTESTGKRKTWGIISQIVNKVTKSTKELNETKYLKDSFFDQCFLTELNHIPSKYTEGSGLSDKRKKLLNKKFYKTFPVVIIGARSYLTLKEASDIKEIFDANYECSIELDTIGKKKPRTLIIDKYSSAKQNIYICDQLRGSSGWSKIALDRFVQEITGGNNI